MPTIDDLLNENSGIEVYEDEVFLPADGYATVSYNDAQTVFIDGKSIGDLSGQISVSGEANSQYIQFERDRYADGIDLLGKIIQIHYEREDGVGDNSPAVNVEYSETRIRFGWLVPGKAVAIDGILRVAPFVYGTDPSGDTYIMKDIYAEYTVNEGLALSGGIEEPEEEWYTQFLAQMQSYLSQATEQAQIATEAVQTIDEHISKIYDSYDDLCVMFKSLGYYIGANIMDYRTPVDISASETLKYIPWDIPYNCCGFLMDFGNNNGRNATIYPRNGEAYTIRVNGNKKFLPLNYADVDRIAIWITTTSDVVSDIKINAVAKKFIDLDDPKYIITNEFNSEEAKVVTESWSVVYGDLMRSNRIKVAPGDIICVESGYCFPYNLSTTLCHPYYKQDEDLVYAYDNTFIRANHEGLSIPEPCGYISILYGSNDKVKIYRKRRKKGNEQNIVDFLGDSITAGYITSSVADHEYGYPNWVGQRLCLGGINNYGVGGTTVSIREGYSNSFLERMHKLINDSIDEEGKSGLRLRSLFVLGGTNDYSLQVTLGDSNSPEINIDSPNYETITFYKSYEKLLQICLEAYEGRVVCATPLPRTASPSAGYETYALKQYIEAIVELCERFSVPCLRLDTMSTLNPGIASVRSRYFSDGVHPGQWGQACVLAPIVADFIEQHLHSALCEIQLPDRPDDSEEELTQ